MTESYFRGASFRVFEFFCYSILRLFRSPRADTVSLGLGQVQARRWAVELTWSSVNSWEVAYDLISESFPESACSLRAKVAMHVGEVRGFYMTVAEGFHTQAKTMAKKATLRTLAVGAGNSTLMNNYSAQSRSVAQRQV